MGEGVGEAPGEQRPSRGVCSWRVAVDLVPENLLDFEKRAKDWCGPQGLSDPPR